MYAIAGITIELGIDRLGWSGGVLANSKPNLIFGLSELDLRYLDLVMWGMQCGRLALRSAQCMQQPGPPSPLVQGRGSHAALGSHELQKRCLYDVHVCVNRIAIIDTV